MNTSVKWAAELAHVREVSLLGTADLAFWKDQLLKEELLPAESDGRAQLLIIAADSKFVGVRFRELSFCVSVSPPDDGIRQDAAYLVRAFNSCRCRSPPRCPCCIQLPERMLPNAQTHLPGLHE